MNRSVLVLIAILIINALSLYDKFSSVKQLTASDFSQVKKGIWLV
jgi:hypothetical protein